MTGRSPRRPAGTIDAAVIGAGYRGLAIAMCSRIAASSTIRDASQGSTRPDSLRALRMALEKDSPWRYSITR